MLQISRKSAGHTGAVPAERRTKPRRSTSETVRLRFYGGCAGLTGELRDVSAAGVRIRFKDICAVPPVFELDMPGEVPRRAVIRWRTLTEIGATLE